MSNCGNGYNSGLETGRRDARRGFFDLPAQLARVTLQTHNHYWVGFQAGYRLGFAEILVAGQCPTHYLLEEIVTRHDGQLHKKCD